MKRLKQLKKWIFKQLSKITPGKTATKGAAIALLIASGILYFINAISSVVDARDPWFFLLFLLLALIVIAIAYVFVWILKKVNDISKIFKLALFIAVPLLLLSLAFEEVFIIAGILIFTFLGAAISIFSKGQFTHLSTTQKTVTILGVIIGLVGLIGGIIAYMPSGFKMEPIVNAAALNSDSIEQISAPSPAEKGSYIIKTLTYGSGKDKHRTEFGEEATIKTDSVNGVPFLDNWEGFSGWYREQFWGFDATSLPINGYVWYPEGEGPFPLALIVHGNHLMSDFSDIGYAYLGELLASRGIIVASVDENFLNGSWSDISGGLEEENDARGWMLLEHLKVWHQWNNDKSNLFYNKIDTTNIALMGHSRGGEAVGHAAFLNKLPFYSDDASIPLNYNYNIKSIVAIAPVDRQYEPGNTPNEIEDVSYFTIHGSQDGDVSSFAGSKQYERVTFSDSTSHFKSGVYVQGANHGQFNTSWGANDVGMAATGFLNNAQLLSKDDQEQIAKVYISAFLETTLKNNNSYLSLFTDARKGKEWLPETIYLNQYENSSFKPVATYDEDFNVLTTNDTLTTIGSHHLSVWKEQEISLKWGEKGSRAAYLGWHYDNLKDGEIIHDTIKASYSFSFKTPLTIIDSTSALTFSLAEATEKSNPKSSGKWVDNNEDEDKEKNEDQDDTTGENSNNKDDKEDATKDDFPEQPIDFTIQLLDSNDIAVSFCLSDFSALQREIGVRIWKAQFITDETLSEPVFQTFVFPLAGMQKIDPDFDVMNIQKIQFVFDNSTQGVIILDNVGFMKDF